MRREKAAEQSGAKGSAASEIGRGTAPTLEEAKLRFYEAASAYAPLGFVRRRPFASVGMAFLAGFGISALGGTRAAAPALATAAQVASLVSQFAPLLLARSRGRDGQKG